MSDVFLSYASEDRARAESIARALQAQGWSVWWDKHISAGQRFRDAIDEEVGKARSVAVLWSASSIAKDWIREEADSGRKRGVLLPVLIELVEQPRGFREIQAANLSGWSGDPNDAVFRALCQDLASMLRAPEDVTGYLTTLWNLTRQIEIKNLRTSDASANAFDIDELYTPLTTVLPHEHRTEMDEAEIAAVHLEQALKERRLVLVGDPGAGKTTFLRRIAFEACHRLLGKGTERPVQRMLPDPCPFPILISAGEFATHVQNCADKDRIGALVDPKSPEWLLHYLGSAYPKPGATYFRAQFEKECLLLVDGLDEIAGETARGEMTELLKRAADAFPRLQIVATSRPGVYGGITNLPRFKAHKIAPLDRKARDTFATKWGRAVYPQDQPRAAELTRLLLKEIDGKREIRLMAENPMMLTALACLHFSKTTLPEQRSELYDSVLEWLAKARQAKTGLDHNVLLTRLRKLAYAMHAGKKNKRTEIERYEAIGLLKSDFRNEQDEAAQRLAAERFLEEEEVNSGIIVNRGDKLRFWHPTFQEYLAAVRLTYDPGEREKRLFDRRLSVHDPDWRETVLLLAGCLKKQGDEPVDELLEKILARDPTASLLARARRAGLMGALLNDLAAWQYRLPPRLESDYRDLLTHVLSIFEKEAARRLPFETRLEAAEALGRAGDPRLAEGVDNWVSVEGAEFALGATGRRVKVAPFLMARYPVTVTEYKRFVDSDTFHGLSKPPLWQDQLGYPNRPVIGVSWFNASAYCIWKAARLPSEEEWECAARCGRQGVEYPWGSEEPDEFRANHSYDGSPQAPTPVGMYPEGATPNGIQDLVGNVWEWTASEQAEGLKVLRGGGWSLHPAFLRMSRRDWVGPASSGLGLGFRCARDLPF